MSQPVYRDGPHLFALMWAFTKVVFAIALWPFYLTWLAFRRHPSR